MAYFTIVGTGAGTEQYMLSAAVNLIEEADILIGGQRNLDPWIKDGNKKYYKIESHLQNVVQWIKDHYQTEKVVVLVSGDPGFYSLLNYLSKYFKREEIRVIPGISSIQIAFARLALSWHDAVLLNLHGRPLSILDKYINTPKIALLTDPHNSPKHICQYLISKGQKNTTVHICTNLGYPDEVIRTIELERFREIEKLSLNPSVMVILNE